ncbi:Hypothetical predicted protein [Cloeon dipterum]|uniref:E3 ubiquitin-protein ligase n=1 Tax=Cloeon dipterum TaxID=197152 RepID=A0A8S1D2X7_9INSE|nr:Hypothetical predicted protein [Cloeon dipterum]
MRIPREARVAHPLVRRKVRDLPRTKAMAVPSDVVDLLNMSKEEAARTLAAECLLGRTSRLHVFLDEILKPDSAIVDTILWCKVIVACGDTFEEFKTKIKEHDDGKICGLVWTANYVAFRCRTCSISPCMSLCEPCFRLGDHKGHDWNFFFSQAGGACDCGDVSVMKESGYCSEHGDHAQKKHATKPVPRKLICVSEEVMPKFLLRLVQLLRLHSRGDRPDALPAAEQFIEFLYELSGMGTPMRRVMAASMVDAAIYKHLVDPNRGNIAFLRQSHVDYLEAVRTLPFPEVPERFSDLKDKLERREHLTFLEELNFWIVKLEFPQRIVCFLLNLLTDAEFKEAMTNAFILHYSRVAVVLARSAEPDPLSNRVVHNLLHVMVIGLRHMMSNIHMDSNLNYLERRKRTHRVIDCETQVMKDHCYWPLVSDLNNVLSHREVAFTFMSDPNLITEWFTLLSFFQGMNLNKREMEKHIEFEPSSYYAAFSAELEASAYPMWTMLSHLTEQNEIPLTKTVLGHCLNALEKWFVAIGLTVDSEIDSLQVSFHLPLHRFYAVLLCQAIRQGIPLKEIIPPSNTLQLILTHLLRIQVGEFHFRSLGFRPIERETRFVSL